MKKRVTQEQLAAAIDMGTTHISHIETANTVPSLKTFVAIVNALDVSADELLCGSIDNADAAYMKEIADLMKDCTPEELRIISETVKALKRALRRKNNSIN
jgi:transcriptional regulator with XRE-family HTH domain